MDSVMLDFLLKHAIWPVVIVVVWIIRKVLFLDTSVAVIQAESNIRVEVMEAQRAELMASVKASNAEVKTQLSSIENFLRQRD